MKTLIAGSGDLGMRVAMLLAEAGHEVRCLRRNPPTKAKTAFQHNRIEWIAGDLTNIHSLSTLPAGVTHVVFAAAPGQRTESAYRSLYVGGLQNLVMALDRGVLQRVLFVSSTAVYGEHGDQWVDESTPTAPQGFNGRVMLEAEQWLLGQSVQSIILRLSGIYGPGRDQLLDRIRQGLASVPRGVRHWTNRIHIEDAARAVVHFLDLPDPLPVYLVTDGHPYPMDTLYDALADKLGVPKPSEGTAPAMIGSKRLSNQRLLATGFKLRWPDALAGYDQLIHQASG